VKRKKLNQIFARHARDWDQGYDSNSSAIRYTWGR